MQIAPFQILRVQTDFGARVNLFFAAAYQTASAAAAFTLDGFDDLYREGVILDVQKTVAIDIWCAVSGHGRADNSTNIPLSVTNKSGATRSIQVTLTYWG
jgi:hypothetical protein